MAYAIKYNNIIRPRPPLNKFGAMAGEGGKMNKKVQKILGTMLTTLAPIIAVAKGTVTGSEVGNATGGTFDFGYYFKVIAAAGGLIFLVILVIGGIMYITAAGNEEASTKAKKLLVDAIIGIVVIGIAWFFGIWLLKFLGIGWLSGLGF